MRTGTGHTESICDETAFPDARTPGDQRNVAEGMEGCGLVLATQNQCQMTPLCEVELLEISVSSQKAQRGAYCVQMHTGHTESLSRDPFVSGRTDGDQCQFAVTTEGCILGADVCWPHRIDSRSASDDSPAPVREAELLECQF